MSESNVTRIRATIQYEGTDFHGSQLQSGVRTVQGEIEGVLARLLDTDVRVDFAGRTDAGVHALGQEIAFDAPAKWEPKELARAFTAISPDDIAVTTVRDGGAGFHPRFDADRRRYIYVVVPSPDSGPFLRRFAWRPSADHRLSLPPGEATIDRLGDLAAVLPGERDFAGFAKAGQPERGSVCTVESARWSVDDRGHLRFDVCANRFLHHMVRYLVGTMIEVIADRRPAADMETILELGTPTKPVFPAPPGGLYLAGVRYADGWNREGSVPW